ncbi:exodeoxyribonuclease VII large subunit, partial [Gloeocapsopsis crepidinum]
PALVQGEQAPSSIAKAIARVEEDGRAEVLILARGGGAVEELACFNDERVVRAIAQCSIPVITGIGHQRDESLADLVADVCVHTPTAAAECVVPELQELYFEHQQRITTLCTVMYQQLKNAENQLEEFKIRLRRLRLEQKILQERQLLASQRHQLVARTKQQLQQATLRCQFLEQKLASLDPKAVLKRGYAVVRQEQGEIVRHASNLAIGQKLFIQLTEGQVKVEVTQIIN